MTPIFDQTFFSSEIVRLQNLLNLRCHQCYDSSEITVTVEEWSASLLNQSLEFFAGECQMSNLIGRKVKTIPDDAQTTAGVTHHQGKIAYGVISDNILAYAVAKEPFEGFDNVPEPDPSVFSGQEVYETALKEYRNQQSNREDLQKHLASILYIRWFDANGTEICQAWHDARTLQFCEVQS